MVAFLSAPARNPQVAEGPPRFQRSPKEPDVRFSLIRLNHISSLDGMRSAVPNVSHQSLESEVLVVP